MHKPRILISEPRKVSRAHLRMTEAEKALRRKQMMADWRAREKLALQADPALAAAYREYLRLAQQRSRARKRVASCAIARPPQSDSSV